MDRGSWNGQDLDTDDPDTPNDAVPPWDPGIETRPEGVAQGFWANYPWLGSVYTTGNPPDDTQWLLDRRPPCLGDTELHKNWPTAGWDTSVCSETYPVRYEVTNPAGTSYMNENPSGNLEWERFRIDSGQFDRNLMDYHAEIIPEGVWQLHVTGLDLHNLVAFRFFNDLIGMDEDGNPAPPPSYLPPQETVGGTLLSANKTAILSQPLLSVAFIILGGVAVSRIRRKR